MRVLDKNSRTGPDNVATIIVKRYRWSLAFPITKLVRRIFSEGYWSHLWTFHWIFALHKRNSIYNPEHYRGIHLTSQLSKLVERILRGLFLPTLERNAFGTFQFAYRSGRGARDAIAFYVLSWIEAFNHGQKIGLYASDVSGAFDKVSASLLLYKLEAFGLHW